MATETSRLIVELMDRVSEPARRVSSALAGITRETKEQNKTPLNYATRVDAASARNEKSLTKARNGLFGAAAGFYMLKQAIGAPLGLATEFEGAMADVTKVVDFESVEAFQDFRKEIIGLSRDIPVGVNGLARIAAAAGSQGIAGVDLTKFTDAAARIGVAFDISAGEAGTSMAKIKTSLGLTIDETVLLADAMNHLSNSQASTAAEIQSVIKRVGAQAKGFGLAAKETAALGSAMIAGGAEANVAATSVRNMGRALTLGESATKRQKDAFAEIGLTATDTADRMQDDAVGTIIDVMERLKGIPKEARSAVTSNLFGNEARALGPLLDNVDLLRDSFGLVGEEADFAGGSFEEAERRMDTFGGSMTTFGNHIAEIGIAIGESLKPAISAVTDLIRPMATAFASFVRENKGLAGTIFAVTGAVIGLRVAIAAFRFLGLLGRGGVLSMISFGLKGIGATAVPLGRAVTQSVGLQRALAGMAGTKLGALGTIKAGLSGIAGVTGLSGVGAAFGSFAAVVAGISAPVWGTVAAVAAAIGAAGFTIYKYWDRLTAIFDGVKDAIGDRLAPVIEAFGPQIEALKPFVKGLLAPFRALWDAAKGAFDFIKGLFNSSFFTQENLTPEEKAAIEARTEAVIDRFLGLPGRLIEVGKDMARSIWDGFKETWADFIAWIKSIPSQIKTAIGKINLRDMINWPSPPAWWSSMFGGGGGDPGPNAGGLVERARGGPVSRGRTYMTGERGRELFTPSRSGYVTANALTERLAAGAGSIFGASAPGEAKGASSGNLGGGVTISPTFNFSNVSAQDAETSSPVLEWVGEGAETWTVKGKIFPFKFGGLDDLERLRQARKSGLPQYMMRGDGSLMGWVAILSVKEASTYLSATGIGKVIEVDISVRRSDAPRDGSFFSIMNAVMAWLN
ncbi:MAG: phage tail tape measure protein [Loktanella sp.]|nr:phage tail tape measure protein [Loktanella sp.]